MYVLLNNQLTDFYNYQWVFAIKNQVPIELKQANSEEIFSQVGSHLVFGLEKCYTYQIFVQNLLLKWCVTITYSHEIVTQLPK
jgi:hypothetical protein